MTNQSPEPMQTAPKHKQPLWPILTAIFSSAIALGVLLIALDAKSAARLDDYRALLLHYQAETASELRSFHEEAASDRRVFQAGMDEFRREILRLSERQSHLEGMLEAHASTTIPSS